MVTASRLMVALAVVVAGCGDDDAPADASRPDAMRPTDDPAARPQIPWLEDGSPVSLAPCPDGWREVTDADGIVTCDPYPAGGASECAFGEAHFPGEPGCRPIGDPCPDGAWPADLPADDAVVVYVEPGATGGDGSRASPFGTLDQVPWSLRGEGWTIALAKGTHVGNLPLRGGAHVLGACTAETIVTGVEDDFFAVIGVSGGRGPAVVENLALLGGPQEGAGVAGGDDLTLRGVLMDGVTGLAISARNAGTVVTLTDVVVTRTAQVGGQLGHALDVAVGAEVSATRFIAADNGSVGVLVLLGAVVTLEDAVVRDTQSRARDGIGGQGINLSDGGRLTASRLLVSGNHHFGFALGEGDEITVTDTVVRDTQPQPDGSFGTGIRLDGGARFEATRLWATGNRYRAFIVADEGTTVSLNDAVITDTLAEESSGLGGSCAEVLDGGHLSATGVICARNVGMGLGVHRGTAVFTDVAVRGTRPRVSDGRSGHGMQFAGATVELERVLLESNHEIGVLAALASEVTVADVVVRDTGVRPTDSHFGIGVDIQDGTQATIDRLLVDGANEVGLAVLSDASVVARDVVIGDVARSASGEAYRLGGYAVAAWGGQLDLTRFALRDSETCGLFLAPQTDARSELDVSVGVVERVDIGACVQIDGYDLARIGEEVVYRDNGTNIDATSLPVPGVPDSLE